MPTLSVFRPDEDADAVVHVDDVVALLQVAEVGEERTRRGLAPVLPLPVLVEDVGFGEQHEAGVRQPEAPRQAPLRDQHRHPARRLGAVDGDRRQLVLAQQFDGALGAAAGADDEHHDVFALARASDLGDPVLQAPAEFERRLAGDVPRGSASSPASGSSCSSRAPSSMPNCSSRTAVASCSFTPDQATISASGSGSDCSRAAASL